MQVHPDQPENPLYEDIMEILDYERVHLHDWRSAGKPRTIEVAEHNEKIVRDSVIDAQNICLPTINKLRNAANIAQLQERVYQKLLPHFDALNICILRSRTTLQADHCFKKYQENYEIKFKVDLKNILLEY